MLVVSHFPEKFVISLQLEYYMLIWVVATIIKISNSDFRQENLPKSAKDWRKIFIYYTFPTKKNLKLKTTFLFIFEAYYFLLQKLKLQKIEEKV